jgi:crotonobetainyl-CoA:carnitine CoA-transferase CaiB-like acyl-CoA transferase
MSALPLEGVRILAVEQYGAGPFGTQFLADQGAEVIKIEAPGEGDYARTLGPHFFENGDSQFFHSFNRNKKSLTLDLKQPEGRAVFLDLVKTADAVASNSRGDVAERLGITYEQLKDANPKIVCAHLSAYGRTGSRAAWPGFDFLMQAEAGHFSVTGEPDTPPARMGLSVVDLATGLGLAFAVAAGIVSARATGRGQDLDTSLFHMAHMLNVYTSTWYLNAGHVQGRTARSGHASLVPCQLYRTQDGWIYIMCNKEKFWPVLCDAIGEPGWATDPRFKSFKERLANRELVQELLDERLSERTTADWLAAFSGAVPSSPVYDLAQALDNPFVAEQGIIQELDLEGHGPIRMIDTPVRTETPTPTRPASPLGGDTEKILSDIGYDKNRLAQLRKAGVI